MINQRNFTNLFVIVIFFSPLVFTTAIAQTLPSGEISVPGTLSTIGDGQSIDSNTTLSILPGGTVGNWFDAGSRVDQSSNVNVNVYGGTIGSNFRAQSGSIVNIYGGSFDSEFRAHKGSEVNVYGGTFGPDFLTDTGGPFVTLYGGEFLLNGSPITGQITYPGPEYVCQDVLTGTLEDGSPIILTPYCIEANQGLSLASTSVPTVDTTPIIIDDETAPNGLRAGQTLSLIEGGVLGKDFAAVSGTLNIAGGKAHRLELVDSILNVSGGEVTNPRFFGRAVEAEGGNTLNISGGSVNGLWSRKSDINISGGVVDRLYLYTGNNLKLSGGSLSNGFDVLPGNTVNLLGTQFFLDGEELSSIRMGETFEVKERDVILSGLLADGSEFSYDLSSNWYSRTDYFDTEAKLTITIVPESNTAVLAMISLLGVAGHLCRIPI